MTNDYPMKIVLYYVFSLFTVIVNLNLLIALISAIFEKVMITMDATDAKGKAGALTEISIFKKFFFSVRLNGTKETNFGRQYMHIIKNDQ